MVTLYKIPKGVNSTAIESEDGEFEGRGADVGVKIDGFREGGFVGLPSKVGDFVGGAGVVGEFVVPGVVGFPVDVGDFVTGRGVTDEVGFIVGKFVGGFVAPGEKVIAVGIVVGLDTGMTGLSVLVGAFVGKSPLFGIMVGNSRECEGLGVGRLVMVDPEDGSEFGSEAAELAVK